MENHTEACMQDMYGISFILYRHMYFVWKDILEIK